MTESLPSIYAYLDHRAFLQDWFEAKQGLNKRYSHRSFAKRAGFGSPSLLQLVWKGDRNITDRSLPGFVRALGFDAGERKHFELLIAFDRAPNAEERNSIFERLRSARHFQAAQSLAAFDYLSDWTLPAIRELAGCPGFTFDPVWVAAHLVPKISVARARRSLETLVRIGMLDGSGCQTETAVVTPHEIASLAAFNYHQAMLGLSTDALENIEPDLRHFGAVTVRVAPERLQQLKDEIGAFQERVLALCDNDTSGDRVVQLNLQLFPLSQRTQP